MSVFFFYVEFIIGKVTREKKEEKKENGCTLSGKKKASLFFFFLFMHKEKQFLCFCSDKPAEHCFLRMLIIKTHLREEKKKVKRHLKKIPGFVYLSFLKSPNGIVVHGLLFPSSSSSRFSLFFFFPMAKQKETPELRRNRSSTGRRKWILI